MSRFPTPAHLVTFVTALGIAFVGITYFVIHDQATHDRGAAVGGVQIQRSDGDLTTGPGSSLAGSVSGLVPGVAQPLEIEIENHNDFDVAVTELIVTARGGSTECPSSMLLVEVVAGEKLVPPNSKRSQTFMVALSANAPDGCKNVLFPLEYSGTVVKA